jgi:F-type H+-transporting ATPase subunit b
MRIRMLLAAAAVGLAVLAPAGAAFAQEAPPEGEGGHELTHEAEECIKLLEEGKDVDTCQEAPSPIMPATNELIWGSIAFITVFVLLGRLAYPAIKKTMDERTEKIRGSLDDAERTRSEAQTILEDYQRQLNDARNESNRIIEEARQTADQLRQDLMQRAESEVGDLRRRAQEDIQAAQQRAVADLRSQVSNLAIELAEKVVERNLDRDTNVALIESYINQLESTS